MIAAWISDTTMISQMNGRLRDGDHVGRLIEQRSIFGGIPSAPSDQAEHAGHQESHEQPTQPFERGDGQPPEQVDADVPPDPPSMLMCPPIRQV